ncbi:MAG: hypothetical protein A2138_12935 [Deltaproteobacteria bacterium RBG_16_71_12]|nr:MAG: hypothetical protein A2138_12935 [Deltaproteobacteria bacterium RBG_16_71_12]
MGEDEVTERRVFLEVRDPTALVADIDAERPIFVPTRLPVPLGALFMLAIRLESVGRAIELPMRVVGRRLPRGGSRLSAGVLAQLLDRSTPMLALLREVVAGRVVDLEARIQQQQRIPARACFASRAEVLAELHALVDHGEAQVPVDRLVQRGDRLALSLIASGDDATVTTSVLVRSVHTHSGRRTCLVRLLDDDARAALAAALAGGTLKQA